MQGADGNDYMYMWTQILAGKNGLGEDFDLFQIAGPQDFKSFFDAYGPNIIEGIKGYIKKRAKRDLNFRQKVADVPRTRRRFIQYYATKASGAFSLGSHDEWNIFVEINRRRREYPKLGIGEQIPVIYDGRSLSTAEMETSVSPGLAQSCSCSSP